MGKPVTPTQAQIAELRRAANLSAPETLQVRQGQFSATLPAHGLALVEIH